LFIYFLSNGYFFPLLFAQNTTANLGTGFSVEICKESSFSIKDINNQSCFKETSLSELSKEKYPDKVWLKITVTDTTQKFILFDKVDSIKAHFDNRIFLTGNLVAQSQKQVLTSRIINAIQIPIYQNPFYVELSPSKKLPFSAKIDFLTETDFTQNYVEIRQNDILLHAVFQGMLWIILLYNFFLFIASKERVYLAYSVYVLGFSIFNAQNTGFLGDFFIAEYPSLSILVRIIGLTLIFIGNTFFAILFLPSYTISKAWLKYFTFVWMLVSVLTFVYIFLYYGLENEYIYTIMSKIIHGIIMLTFLIFFANLARKYWSDTMIKYFLIGSAMVVMGASIYNVLSSLGIKNSGIVVQVGGIAEILIFSLGLGYRMKKLEKENARILENQNKILEQRVTERTREISIKQEEILVQNEELQQQQEEIISQRDYIETQNKQLKHTNTQFTDSVRYAKTIQKAILPLKERVQNYFEDSFVLFRPRDIVSGDFYWFYEATDPQTQEEVILLAVLDCTGHGVPGAFISLIGFAILNEIVAKEDLISPSEILIRLDERIQESLRQKQTQNLDGMDVALCAIRKINTTNSENFEVKFSGAKRPLYFIKDNQFEELKGTKLSIGGITRKKISDKYHFEEQTIILSKNDKIYLTSDGFADQNGYNRQKIGSSQLKDYFDEFHHLPFAEQRKKFEEILDNHQGKQKQRDDITILGLKL
jgi:serine phosphatase RsbU (regulator of sigma subunit)